VMQFPVAFWILILALDATSDALRNAATSEISQGLFRVAGISLIFAAVSFLLFEYVLEE
jgi:hypothetical protein